jgi:hypothetical protein
MMNILIIPRSPNSFLISTVTLVLRKKKQNTASRRLEDIFKKQFLRVYYHYGTLRTGPFVLKNTE